MNHDRRQLLRRAGAGALAAAIPESLQRALATPAHHRTGTIQDVEHIVSLMQENRSFDHYFGTLRGVRGFGDKRAVRLPSTVGYAPADFDTHPDYVPPLPLTQALPKQEPGVRPARPVPYELHVLGDVDPVLDTVKLGFANRGSQAAVFQVRSGDNQQGPWTYTVGPRDRLADSWNYGAMGQDTYDLSVYGPNGFFRAFKGGLRGKRASNLLTAVQYEREPGVTLEIVNRGQRREKVRIYDAYTQRTVTQMLDRHERLVWHWPLEASFGWYDLTITAESDERFREQIAGHVETGRDSASDPALGA